MSVYMKEKVRDQERGRAEAQGSPGHLAVENLPANAGDMGLIPAPGRFHMQRSN